MSTLIGHQEIISVSLMGAWNGALQYHIHSRIEKLKWRDKTFFSE